MTRPPAGSATPYAWTKMNEKDLILDFDTYSGNQIKADYNRWDGLSFSCENKILEREAHLNGYRDRLNFFQPINI